jgi:hypothetical protein
VGAALNQQLDWIGHLSEPHSSFFAAQQTRHSARRFFHNRWPG